MAILWYYLVFGRTPVDTSSTPELLADRRRLSGALVHVRKQMAMQRMEARRILRFRAVAVQRDDVPVAADSTVAEGYLMGTDQKG